MTTIAELVGQRVLVSVFDGPPRMTTVRAMSPSGQYVWLPGELTEDENVGWQHVARVKVLEVLQPASETMQALDQRLAAKAPEVEPELPPADPAPEPPAPPAEPEAAPEPKADPIAPAPADPSE